MELSLLVPTPSLTPSRRPLLPPINPNPLRLRHLETPLRLRRCRLRTPKSYVSEATISSDANPRVTWDKKELTGTQALADAIPPPARLAVSVALVAGAAAGGYGLGLRFGASQLAAAGGATVLGAVGGAAAYALNACVPEVAAVRLYNLVAGYGDLTKLRREDIEAIEKKYGVNKEDPAYKMVLCEVYSRPLGGESFNENDNLKGNEVETIIKFKNALGIDDPDAASVHMEIGRRIFRQRLETGDREADLEQRRAFQRLIYVSTLVFGDASSFLLPWKRLFKVTDSQVEIAIRDNAQRLYAAKLVLIGRDVDDKQLISLREAQLLYKLSDEIAADMFREWARKQVEENISAALNILKSRTRAASQTTGAIEELDKIIRFNDSLMLLSKHPEVNRFAPGIGPVSLIGGEYDGDRKMDDLKILYRAYCVDALSGKRLEENKRAALNQLKNIFGLGKREAEVILLEVTSNAYRKRLSLAVSSGELQAADSKAAYLQKLCEDLRFDPEKASGIHKDIYRQRLQKSVEDGVLDDDDNAALLRLRVLLCIPQQTVEDAHADICGRLFEKVVKDAIASGVDGYDAEAKAAVRKASQGLRLKPEAAMAIASKAVRMVFVNYVKRSRMAGNREESARELKKMIIFNSLVVTELIADIKGEPVVTNVEPAKKDSEQSEEEEWESLQTLRKTRPSKELEAKLGKPGQTEITLKDDLPERDRADLYKTYLLFCISGEKTVVPFGAQVTIKKDNSEYLYLNQLGGMLGLTSNEIVEIHRGLAEQAFMKQAEVILADGQLTKVKVEQLNEVQKQLGLPAEYAQKVIKNITSTKMAAAIETAVSRGTISMAQIRQLKEANVEVDNMIPERLRENLYKKTVDEILSSGTGDFDDEEVYEKIPADLSINAEKAKGVVHELAQERLSNSLVQAVSLLRQKNREGVVSSLNNMLACDKAVTAVEPLSWSLPEELSDLYCLYLKSIPKPEKLSRLQYLLGIDDSAASALRDAAERGEVLASSAEEENDAFDF
ncbi:hypothetical protein QJS04_geneDACA005895 [Acorus gramineus]|uniref:Protein TIC110, chloroplastic n=2 Tax=Acorus gramineus TaxID=55184 RepID=A0AAV9B6D7_ACOGR|nr:hypothetical protein QJS04_geneDACA005895 [Acorus gramineus]